MHILFISLTSVHIVEDSSTYLEQFSMYNGFSLGPGKKFQLFVCLPVAVAPGAWVVTYTGIKRSSEPSIKTAHIFKGSLLPSVPLNDSTSKPIVTAVIEVTL